MTHRYIIKIQPDGNYMLFVPKTHNAIALITRSRHGGYYAEVVGVRGERWFERLKEAREWAERIYEEVNT